MAYPNRDSVPFQKFYNIPEAHTVIRGSLRYKGNPAFVQALAKLGWLEQDKKEWLKDGMTRAEIQQAAVGASGTDEKYGNRRLPNFSLLTVHQLPRLANQIGRRIPE